MLLPMRKVLLLMATMKQPLAVTLKEPAPARWYYYAEYTVACCDTPPPPPTVKYGTAFAKGGYVFVTEKKANPENLPSLNLIRNRWGWAI